MGSKDGATALFTADEQGACLWLAWSADSSKLAVSAPTVISPFGCFRKSSESWRPWFEAVSPPICLFRYLHRFWAMPQLAPLGGGVAVSPLRGRSIKEESALVIRQSFAHK